MNHQLHDKESLVGCVPTIAPRAPHRNSRFTRKSPFSNITPCLCTRPEDDTAPDDSRGHAWLASPSKGDTESYVAAMIRLKAAAALLALLALAAPYARAQSCNPGAGESEREKLHGQHIAGALPISTRRKGASLCPSVRMLQRRRLHGPSGAIPHH